MMQMAGMNSSVVGQMFAIDPRMFLLLFIIYVTVPALQVYEQGHVLLYFCSL